MRYSLAIFDLDGTLADSFPWFLSVVNGVAREYRFREIAPQDVEPLRSAGTREIVRHLGVPMWKVPAIARRMRALKREQLGTIPLFPGTDAMLRTLREAGVTLALVTSDNEENARRQLGRSADHFALFDCGASIFGKAKKFRRVARRTGLPPGQTLSIGDETRDIEAARAAGIACAAVSWGYAAPNALRAMQPDVMFERMDDVVPALAL